MADSNATKRAFAHALKTLMEETPFEKINVTQICQQCGMNRKSFYYHFKDKYDLVNWIYDTEFFAVASQQTFEDSWDFILELLQYLYENQKFYRKALRMTGQNSFPIHFREVLLPLIDNRLRQVITGADIQEFHINFFADAFACAIGRWLLDKNLLPPEEFLRMLRSCIENASESLHRNSTEQ